MMIRTARVIPGETSVYGHFFGGSPMHEGSHFGDPGKPIHLVYCLNTRDPLLRELKEVCKVDWLPLYYGFHFDDCRFGYLVESDHAIRVFSGEQRFENDWPYPGYPSAFPRIPIHIEALSREHVQILARAHELYSEGDWLFEQLKQSERALLNSWSYPFTQIGGTHHLTQGEPANPCPNPCCKHCHKRGSMTVFATVWNHPVPGVCLWGDAGDFVELVYEFCAACGTIAVSNQCD